MTASNRVDKIQKNGSYIQEERNSILTTSLIADDTIKNIEIKEKGSEALKTGYFNKTRLAQRGKSYTNERGLQKVFSQWIDENYPGLFYFGTLNGEWVSEQQGLFIKAITSKVYKIPDFWLIHSNEKVIEFVDFEVRERVKTGYKGLIIELKMDNEPPYTGNKSWGGWRSEHVMKQAQSLEYLRQQGFRAVFATGLLEAKQQFSYYMSL